MHFTPSESAKVLMTTPSCRLSSFSNGGRLFGSSPTARNRSSMVLGCTNTMGPSKGGSFAFSAGSSTGGRLASHGADDLGAGMTLFVGPPAHPPAIAPAAIATIIADLNAAFFVTAAGPASPPCTSLGAGCGTRYTRRAPP